MKVFDLSEFQPDQRVYDLAEHHDADGFLLKLGETLRGEPTMDEKFVMFVNDVIENQLPYGLYYVSHARNQDDFLREAQWINDRIYEYLGDTFPELGIWWDMEVPVVKRLGVWHELRDTIGTWEDKYHDMRIGIYANYYYFTDYLDLDELQNYQIPVWVAQYGPKNSLKKEYPDLKHVAWQYTDTYCPQQFGDQGQDVNEWYGF